MAIKELLLNILFPVQCLNCRKEGVYLCSDCFSLIDIAVQRFCPFCRPPKIVLEGGRCPTCRGNRNLNGLFSASSYQNFIVKRLISQFKYEPFVKELAGPLSSLILQYFKMFDYKPPFFGDKAGFIFMSVPLHRKRLKWRGFNQAEEIAKFLSLTLKIPLISDVLLKIKETQSQTELTAEDRSKNVKGVFVCRNENLIKNKKILLVDDVFTTGATMQECSRVLKQAGAKEIWGITAARE